MYYTAETMVPVHQSQLNIWDLLDCIEGYALLCIGGLISVNYNKYECTMDIRNGST